MPDTGRNLALCSFGQLPQQLRRELLRLLHAFSRAWHMLLYPIGLPAHHFVYFAFRNIERGAHFQFTILVNPKGNGLAL